MTHEMKLHNAPFQMIKKGEKTIELRLKDDKRSRIALGDYILFTNSNYPHDQIRVRVLNLFTFKNFEALYQVLPLDRCGYPKEALAQAHPDDMLAYYSKEQQAKYGVLGIEIELSTDF